LAICAGTPLLPKKLIKLGGDPDYVFSLIVITSLLAIIKDENRTRSYRFWQPGLS